MKLPAVEFSPDRVVIDRRIEWVKKPNEGYFLITNDKKEGQYLRFHRKTPERMAQYCRDLLSDPTRRGFIKEGTLNIVRRLPKKDSSPTLIPDESITELLEFIPNLGYVYHGGFK